MQKEHRAALLLLLQKHLQNMITWTQNKKSGLNGNNYNF